MADLFPLTGLLLPRTPPFDTNGHLVGSLEPGRAVWDYEEFDGRVGQSDLRGTLHYASGKPRPKLSGDLASRKLRLADLGPVVGAPSTKQGQKTRQAASGKALPTQRFDTSKWNAMDMDVRFKSDRIERPDRKSTRLNSSHLVISYAVFCLKKKASVSLQLPTKPRSYLKQERARPRKNTIVRRPTPIFEPIDPTPPTRMILSLTVATYGPTP